MAERRKRTTTPSDSKVEGSEHKDGNGEKATETGLAVRTQSQALTEWTPRFAMTVDQAVELEQQKQEFMQRVLKEDFHYGKIPGAGDRKVLFKAGAEALCAAMRLHPELSDAEPPMIDETGERHNGEPFWSFRRVCRMYVQTGPGPDDRMLVAQAEGSCNSMEIKYRYRDARRVCPECNQATIRQSRPPKDDPNKKQLGFYCWAKPEKGYNGCGARFQWNDQRILNQKVGREKNKDVMDGANTGLKMADKRALVATTLIATGFSTDFTQDLEDRAPDDAEFESQTPDSPEQSTEPTGPPPTTPKVPAAPKVLTAEEQQKKLQWQVAIALGKSLDPPWLKNEMYFDAYKGLGESWPKLIGLLVELHGAQHDLSCEHVQAIPAAADFIYPGTDEERAVVNKARGDLKMPEPKDPEPDEIPF